MMGWDRICNSIECILSLHGPLCELTTKTLIDMTLWIQVAALNALRVQFGGSSIFLGGTWIHRVNEFSPLFQH